MTNVTPQKVSDITLVKKWLEAVKLGKNQPWIANELGITRQLVNIRTIYLRNHGVKLPPIHQKMVRRVPLDVAGLNRLIEQYQGLYNG